MRSTGAVLDLKMQEGLGTSLWDSSPFHNTGTLVNGPTWTQTSSGIWYLNFEAADSEYVNCGNDSSLHTSIMTAMCWYRTSSATTVRLMSKITSPWTGTGWMLYVQGTGGNNRLVCGVCTAGGGNWLNTSNGVDGADGVWHLGVFSWDGTNFSLYTDGSLRDTDTPTAKIQNTAANLLISDNSTEILQGDIYRPRIYTYALSAGQIGDIYDDERSLFGV